VIYTLKKLTSINYLDVLFDERNQL
jgi:hypothetical protein